jgi:hypothetical protein
MRGTIELMSMCPNDQRLFGHKTIDVVVTPYDSKVLPVHVVTVCFFVFGNQRGIIDDFLSFGCRMETVNPCLFWSP